jgi:hypothetical protein
MAKTEAQINALAELLFSTESKLTVDLGTLLDHARAQFRYHADQRIRGIQYFFLAYAGFATAYTGIFKLDANHDTHVVQFVLCALGLSVSIAFWVLDWRNVQLVEIDEDAVNELEEVVAYKFQLQFFKMTEKWNKADYPGLVRYGKVVNALFIIIVLATSVATVNEARQAFFPNQKTAQAD